MHDLLTDVPADQAERVTKELGQLGELGVTVTKVVTFKTGESPRYDFIFPPGEPQWKLRQGLEKAGFDVGSRLGADALGFYAAKRVEKSDGWQV